MYYYKKLNEDDTVDYLISYNVKPTLTDSSFVEITVDEYNTILDEMKSNEPPYATVEDFENALEELGI